jgi:hypothetical protein
MDKMAWSRFCRPELGFLPIRKIIVAQSASVWGVRNWKGINGHENVIGSRSKSLVLISLELRVMAIRRQIPEVAVSAQMKTSPPIFHDSVLCLAVSPVRSPSMTLRSRGFELTSGLQTFSELFHTSNIPAKSTSKATQPDTPPLGANSTHLPSGPRHSRPVFMASPFTNIRHSSQPNIRGVSTPGWSTSAAPPRGLAAADFDVLRKHQQLELWESVILSWSIRRCLVLRQNCST